MDRLEFGRRLRAARAYGAVGRPELGERLNVSTRTIARWEAGRDLPESPEGRLDLIGRICLATEAPAAFFLE